MNNKRLIFRDDDINVKTNVLFFKKVHDLFIEYNVKHRIAVLFEGLFDNYELAHYLCTAPNLEICWHGWAHKRYGILPYEEIADDIQKSLSYWNENTKRRYSNLILPVKVALPTWNQVSEDYKRACNDCGLTVDARCTWEEGVNEFHYWSLVEEFRFKDLEKLLKRESQEPE